MCGRRGSTFTVCASPMWLVKPISTGFLMSVTSMISSPPWGTPSTPNTPWSWQRPGASVASRSSWVSSRAGAGHVRVQDRVALGRGLHVVLEAGGVGGVAQARRGAVAGHGLGRHAAAVGQLEDLLAAAVRADAQGAGRDERVGALGEEVDVGVGVAGGERLQQLPLRARPTGGEGVRRRRLELDRLRPRGPAPGSGCVPPRRWPAAASPVAISASTAKRLRFI